MGRRIRGEGLGKRKGGHLSVDSAQYIHFQEGAPDDEELLKQSLSCKKTAKNILIGGVGHKAN